MRNQLKSIYRLFVLGDYVALSEGIRGYTLEHGCFYPDLEEYLGDFFPMTKVMRISEQIKYATS